MLLFYSLVEVCNLESAPEIVLDFRVIFRAVDVLVPLLPCLDQERFKRKNGLIRVIESLIVLALLRKISADVQHR